MKSHAKSLIFLLVALIALSPAPSWAGTLVSDQHGESLTTSETNGEDSLVDRKAKVFALAGKVEVFKKEDSDWTSLSKDEVINEGDQVRTGEDSYVEIVYDDYFLNYVRLEESSEMKFESIEETDIYLTAGKLFNNLGGLVKDSEYEVSTPSSVAAVRGTSFVREFDAVNMMDDTSVVEGTVNVAPMVDGKIDRAKTFDVKKDERLQFDRQMIQNRAFHQAKPKPMENNRRDQIHQMNKNCESRLANFAGGADRMHQAQNKFQEMRKQPEKSAQLRERMRQPQPRQESMRPGQPRKEIGPDAQLNKKEGLRIKNGPNPNQTKGPKNPQGNFMQGDNRRQQMQQPGNQNRNPGGGPPANNPPQRPAPQKRN